MARKYDDGSELLRASDVDPEEVRFIWEEHIPEGMMSIVAGRPGSRKSMFAAKVAADVTQMGYSVIFSNVEDAVKQVTRPRLEAASADLDKILFWRPFLPAMIEQTERVIRQENVKLIVLDPIVKHMTVSIWNDAEFGEAMVPVFDMLERTGCAILGVHHTKKNVSRHSDPQEAIGGSAGSLLGSARAAFIMGPNPHDATERVVANVKFNMAKEPFSLVYELDVMDFYDKNDRKIAEAGYLVCTDDHSTISARSVLHGIAGGTPGKAALPNVQKVAAAAAWLSNFLAEECQPARTMQQDGTHNGFSWATVKRAAEKLKLVHYRRGFGTGGGWFWGLPMEHPLLIEGGECTCGHDRYFHPADDTNRHGGCVMEGCACKTQTFTKQTAPKSGVVVTKGAGNG